MLEFSAWCTQVRLKQYGIIKVLAAHGFKQLHKSSLATKSGNEIQLNPQGTSGEGRICPRWNSHKISVKTPPRVTYSSNVGLKNGSLCNARDLFDWNTIAYFKIKYCDKLLNLVILLIYTDVNLVPRLNIFLPLTFNLLQQNYTVY